MILKKAYLNDNRAVNNFIPIILVLVISFALLFTGSYINGELDQVLEDSYSGTNTKSGSIDSTYWHNATSNASRNVTLTSPNTVEQLDGTTSKFYILANGSFPIYYNLTVNGVAVNTTSQLTASNGYNHTVTALIAAGALSNGDSYINYSWDVNSSESQIQVRTYGTYYQLSDWRTGIQNDTISTGNNVSGNWDDALDIVQVVVIISLLAIAIGAIFVFTRFRK